MVEVIIARVPRRGALQMMLFLHSRTVMSEPKGREY